MPHPFPLASAFTGGMRRDVDRTEIPGGSAYNMVDFIPDEIQAATAGRGGWTYAGPTLGSDTFINAIGYHQDAGMVVAKGSAHYFDAIVGTSLGSIPGGTTVLFDQAPPFFHRGKLIFPSSFTSSALPQYYDGSSIGSLSAAPAALVGCAYKDHSVLAHGVGSTFLSNPNRVWFSAAGDPTAWDLNFGWWDTTGTVSGVAALTNTILVFHTGSTERLRGTTPPPGSDFVLEPFLPNVGCIDPSSIAYWDQNAIWASAQGIYMSSGVSTTDLTADAQMKTYWQSLMAGYAPSWRISGGVYRDHYIVSVSNGTPALVDCLCVDLTNNTIWRLTNLQGSGFVNVSSSAQEKLYMGLYPRARTAELSTLWSPAAAVKHDGDGTNPTPIVETGMFRGFDRLHRRWIESMGKQKWRYCYVDYDIRDSASDHPTGTLSYTTQIAGSYTQAGLAIPASTQLVRVRRSFSPTVGGATHSQMLGLKFAVTGPYASANLYTIEGSFEPIEIGAL